MPAIDDFNMIKGLQTSALRQLDKLLKDCAEITTSALSERAALIDYHGWTSFARARADSFYDPEPYYNFVVLDKGVSITRPRKGAYFVKTYGWISSVECPACASLDAVFPYFLRTCEDFISYLNQSKEDLF